MATHKRFWPVIFIAGMFASLSLWASEDSAGIGSKGDRGSYVVVLVAPVSPGSSRDRGVRLLAERLMQRDRDTTYIVDNVAGVDRIRQKLATSSKRMDNESCCLVAMSYSDLTKFTNDAASSYGSWRYVQSLFYVPVALVTSLSGPLKTLKDFRGRSSVSVGVGAGYTPDLQIFQRQLGTNFAVTKPTAGGQIHLQDVMAGSMDAAIVPLSLAREQATSGKLRLLGTFGSTKWRTAETFTRVPVIEAELGATPPDNDWVVLLAPAGTNQKSFDKLQSQVRAITRDSSFAVELERLELKGLDWADASFEEARKHRAMLLNSRLSIEIFAGPPPLTTPEGLDKRLIDVDPNAALKDPARRPAAPPDPWKLDERLILLKPPDIEPPGPGKPVDRTYQYIDVGDGALELFKEESKGPVDHHEWYINVGRGAIYGDPTKAKKPPFAATPLGQPLSPKIPRTDNAAATPTPGSPSVGGYPGLTRSGGLQIHQGLDDAGGPRSMGPKAKETVETRFHGPVAGKVIDKKSGAYQDGKYLGERMTVEFKDTDGTTWRSRTMHHKELAVNPETGARYIEGDTVRPGALIAIGAGFGDQFKTPEAGGPHVHWDLRRNGVDAKNPEKFVLVHPLNGAPLLLGPPKNP